MDLLHIKEKDSPKQNVHFTNEKIAIFGLTGALGLSF